MIRCAECLCNPRCNKLPSKCTNCIKEICCCIDLHNQTSSSVFEFLFNLNNMYAAAIAIEILCIVAAEIGENVGLYLFGSNPFGITISYAIGYALAALVTFITILGRYEDSIDRCCSVLERSSNYSFAVNLKTTFGSFVVGIKRMVNLPSDNIKDILKTSLYILITAESACILTAETVSLLFYQNSRLLNILIGLFAGAFVIASREAYKKLKSNKNYTS